jgi:hypothetical protein
VVLYRAVRRLAGPGAGLTAAAVLAVTPVTVLLSRGNVSDSLLILLLVLAADAASAALLTGSLRQLLLAGAWVGHRPGGTAGQAPGRKILRWVDPMHPSYTSDKPGIAPDCGMQLEPVYADGAPAGGATPGSALPPGTVQVSAEQQQLVGVKVGTVERTGSSQNLRLLGRVVPDELRTYVINATIDGWITSIGSSTTGSIVKKDEVLATFYSSEFLSAGQALIYALNSRTAP